MSCFTKNTSCFRYFYIYNMVNMYFHVKLESMYILKNLVDSTCFISVSFISIFVFLFVFSLVLKRIKFFLCLEKVFVCLLSQIYFLKFIVTCFCQDFDIRMLVKLLASSAKNNNWHYYSTIMSFHQIRSRERAKYHTVIHCNVPV